MLPEGVLAFPWRAGGGRGQTPLFRELLAARRTARLPELADALRACGLPIDTGPIWGVAFCEIDSHNYAPVAGGKPAIIALFENGRLARLW